MSKNIPVLEERPLNYLLDKREMKLSIPNYQRPYKWRKEHVIQLLDDLYENIYLKKQNVVYRIGSIIIHQEDGINNIVDGQQRLVTLSLILHYLGERDVLLQNENFENKISKNNIKFNYQQIENWFRSKTFSKEDFLRKIKQGCELVLITVFDEDEAFQLFDSQNSRGKSLYPHDLLKAFHLREMEKDLHSESEMEKYTEKWEEYIMKEGNPLLEILQEHLFRIRNWTKGKSKYFFTKNDISEFKGISLHVPRQFRYETSLRILDGAVGNAQNDRLLKNFNISQSFPFQISMPIINGKAFFDYVFHYIELKKELFDEELNKDFFEFNREYCFGYHGWWRKGDEKVRNMYKNICLHFVDRFDVQCLNRTFYEEFYKNSYQLRLENKSINEISIMNFYNAQKFFSLIEDSYTPEELHSDLYCSYDKEWDEDKYVKGAKEIHDFINKTKKPVLENAN